MAKILLYTLYDFNASGIRLLGAYLGQRGHEVRLFFCGDSEITRATAVSPDFFSSTSPTSLANLVVRSNAVFIAKGDKTLTIPECFLEMIRTWQPDIVGYSGRSALNHYCVDYFPAIRSVAQKALIVAGGFGPNAEPEYVLDCGADIVARGEGEETLADLAEAVDANVAWEDIPNISFKAAGTVVHNPLRPVGLSLDDLPMERMFAPGMYYTRGNTLIAQDPFVELDQFFTYVITGRGCIGSCTYCSSGSWRRMYTKQGLKMPKYRYRSNESVIAELLFRKKHGAKRINFADDFFIRPPEKMRDFLLSYKEKIGLPFLAAFHTDFLARHKDLLHLAVDAGLTHGYLPLQTADADFAKTVFARSNNNEQLLDLAYEFATRYTNLNYEFIEGVSLNKEKSLEKNLDFIRKLPPFDPAFPGKSYFTSHRLRVYSDAPLASSHPEIFTTMLPPKEFFYRTMLLFLRHIMTDEAFAALRENAYYAQNPEPLFAMHVALKRSMHNAYILKQAEALAGQELYFWGCGEVYQARKHLFLGARPQAVLVDVATPTQRIDGLSVLQADSVISAGEALPLVIFSAQALAIARKIKTIYPQYPDEKIIACEAAR